MVFYIQQVSGDKVDQAKELSAAVRSGDMDKARSVYQAEFGAGYHMAENGSGWWIYNAGQNICNHTSVSPAQVFKRAGRKIFGKRYAELQRDMAELQDGGRWEVISEY